MDLLQVKLNLLVQEIPIILDFIKIVKDIKGVAVEELGEEFQMRGRLVQEIDNSYRRFLKNKQ